MRFADRYDLCTIALFVIVILAGGLVTGNWLFFTAIGAAVGNVAAYLLRRRAGVPDRSSIGRLRSRNR